MASDGDRLRAERLWIEGGEGAASIAATIGVAARTVQRWASAGDWEVRRVAFCRGVSRSVAAERAVDAAVQADVLTRAEGLGIVAAIARDKDADARARLAAVKLAAELESWASASADDDAPDQGLTIVPADSPDWRDL